MRRLLMPLTLTALLAAGCGTAAEPHASTAPGNSSTGTARTEASTVPGGRVQRGNSRTAPSRRHPATGRSACPSARLGRLPQTTRRPSTATATFRCEMTALWAGIRTGRIEPALAAFFPEAAYAQVKGIANPQGDWTDRLRAEYALDLQSAHALLGAHAARARLVDVEVPPALPHLVPPGVCYNRLSYWETPNSRVVYREDGALRSLGIASMISWRGTWFVVHLGAILRDGTGGEVDDPSTGAGVATPSNTC